MVNGMKAVETSGQDSTQLCEKEFKKYLLLGVVDHNCNSSQWVSEFEPSLDYRLRFRSLKNKE